MKVHLVQLDSVWEDPLANLAGVERLLETQPPEPGALVVLPEMFATGFSLNPGATNTAVTKGVPVRISRWARQYQVGVLAGVIEEGVDGQLRNQAVLWGAEGEIQGKYMKQRPFSGAGEDACHIRGVDAQVWDWQGVKVAPLVCYDLRFPELFRRAIEAEVFVVMAAWPVARIQHWLTLLQARAIENQAWVVGVNRTGAEPKFQYCGRSVVVDPQGHIVADAGEKEGILTAELEVEVVREWRRSFPAVRDFLRWS